MRKWFRKSMLLASILATSAALTQAEEKEVPLNEVPEAVLKSVKGKFPKAELKKAEKEVEDGETTFELSLTSEGKKMDVALKEDGTILEVETQIKASDLPEAVTKTLMAKYPKATIKKAEEIAKDKKTSYEVVLVDGKEKHEVLVDTTGKIVKDEEEDDD